MRISLIGLGIMGRGMAANLLGAGYHLTVYNRTRARSDELAALGATVAESPRQATEGADVAFTMLSDPPAIHSAVLGEGGAVEGLKPGAVLIDCSTVDPETTRAIADAAAAKGARFMDSPVAGSKDAAAQGELVLMVGGDAAVLEEVRPVLEVISKRIIHAGPTGSGTMLKLCFNLIVAHMGAALAESMVLGVKAGLKPETIVETLMAGVIGSKLYEWKGGCIMDRDFSTNFSLKLMHKDLGLVMNSGSGHNVALPVSAAVEALFTAAKDDGHGEDDFCSVVKVIEQQAGVEVRRAG